MVSTSINTPIHYFRHPQNYRDFTQIFLLVNQEEEKRDMEIPAISNTYYSRNYFFPSTYLFPYYNSTPQNHVNWTQTPESHIYSVEIPGVRKEDISVEVEDSRYLIIQTAATAEPRRSFNRKFRLPRQVNVDGISAAYVAGVLTVTVPRSFVRRGFVIDQPGDMMSENVHLLARAA